MTLVFTGLLAIAIVWLMYQRASALAWIAASAYLFGLITISLNTGPAATATLWIGYALVATIFAWPALRRPLISAPLFHVFRSIAPRISKTEREAMQAGTVGWEGELFTGRPDWQQLWDAKPASLTAEEQAFVEGPTETLCSMIDDWDITNNRLDLSPETWDYIKKNNFFGMIIPRAYGGLEFSAHAHSQVVMKLSTRSISAAVTVMVPNSLGPGKLLLHYGTEQQKDHYLPRLARGEEVPCFALTSPHAGSDASSIPDRGIVCEGEWEGRPTIGIRVTWDKRYITLAPVATLLGLAFHLYDPDHLIGKKHDIGITIALIPTSTPGVNIGQRHLPLNAVFQNGPTSADDLFIPMEWIIGGQERVGQGWAMLMESLSDGRGISLPALSTGAGKFASRVVGAYSRIREQFHMPIGRFEGVEEVLCQIVGETYINNATRKFMTAALDSGQHPSVASAIVKYRLTESLRRIMNWSMDIHGGRGICMGPRNYLARPYQSIPIAITVEGANILTRSLIVFGQGALRAHPFVLPELNALALRDRQQALIDFDKALFGHLSWSLSNAARSLILALSNGRTAGGFDGQRNAHWLQRMERWSSAFALTADSVLISLGPALKRKEKLTGRLADVMSSLYQASAVLKKFREDGEPEADIPLLDWSMARLGNEIETSLDGIIRNLPNRLVAGLLRVLVFPRGRTQPQPSDRLGNRVAAIVLEPSEARDRLTDGAYIPMDANDPIGRVEMALAKTIAAEPAKRKLHKAVVSGRITADLLMEQVQQAQDTGLLDQMEAARIRAAETARNDVIAVDQFDPQQLRQEQSWPEATQQVTGVNPSIS